MKTFQVLTDSTSDLTKELIEESGLDYVKMTFTQNDKEYLADLSWPEISPREYYNAMRNKSRAITGLVAQDQFEKKFTEYLEQGLDVLYISCSSKLSGSYNNGILVAKEFKEKYPERKIICVDSLRSNLSEGYLAYHCQLMANEGKSIEEAEQYALENRLCYQTYATVASLDWLKKAGRVKATAAFFGNLMGVKPIILGDAKGNNYAFKKVKGRTASFNELNNMISQQKNEKTEVVFIEHADSEVTAKMVADLIHTSHPELKLIISDLGPIIGATTGPDTITINFLGKKVTIEGEE